MKLALKIVGIVIALLIVVILVLPFVVNVNNYRPRIESELTTALGRNVTVGNLSLSLWSGSLAADNIAIADDTSAVCHPSLYRRKMFSDCGSSWNFPTSYSRRAMSVAHNGSRVPPPG